MCALLDAHGRAYDSPERRRLPTKRRGSLAAGGAELPPLSRVAIYRIVAPGGAIDGAKSRAR